MDYKYTGYKDKNGRKIVEGDILSLEYEYSKPVFRAGRHLFWVIFVDGEWRLDASYFLRTRPISDFDMSKCVVVVNIHEERGSMK